MLHTKPGVIITSYNALHSLSCSSAPQSTASSSIRGTRSRRTASPRRRSARQYATVSDVPPSESSEPSSPPKDDSHVWPALPDAKSIPTPYQIFNLHKGDAYTKERFYDLVKLYHPDRNHPHCSHLTSHLTPGVKLERYRLIIAAHTLLSDPVKRSAYDRWGAGWNGFPGPNTDRRGGDNERYGPFTSASGWRAGEDCMANATWEDWEAYHNRKQDPNYQNRPLYTSNSAFVSLVVLFAAIGGIGQATRAEGFSRSYVEQRDLVHHRASQDLKKAREGATSTGVKDESIRRFLERRDPEHKVFYGRQQGGEEGREAEGGQAYQRVIPGIGEVCSSENLEKQYKEMSEA